MRGGMQIITFDVEASDSFDDEKTQLERSMRLILMNNVSIRRASNIMKALFEMSTFQCPGVGGKYGS